jgi:hypothetical protein
MAPVTQLAEGLPFKEEVVGSSPTRSNKMASIPEKDKIKIKKQCPHHGLVFHFLTSEGRWKCFKCRSQAVYKKHRTQKQRLVDHFGGKCKLCGYSKCPEALQFHHLDPSKKKHQISGQTRSWENVLKEAKKCVLLCANCHAEVEAGVTCLPEDLLIEEVSNKIEVDTEETDLFEFLSQDSNQDK